MVLRLLGDELDALQDVGDVIDAPLLHVQHLRGPVQVHDSVRRLRQQVEEPFGGEVEGGVVARPLRRAARNYSGKRSTSLKRQLAEDIPLGSEMEKSHMLVHTFTSDLIKIDRHCFPRLSHFKLK